MIINIVIIINIVHRNNTIINIEHQRLTSFLYKALMKVQMGQPKGSPFLQSALFIRASPFFWGGVGLGVGNWGCKRLPGWSLGQHHYYQHLHEVVVRHKSDLLCLLLVNGKGLTDSPTPEYVRQGHDDCDDDSISSYFI